MKRPAALLFDMDGTLLDSRQCWFAIVQEASRHFGGVHVTWEAFLSTFGQASAKDAQQFFPAATEAEVDAFYNAAVPRHVERMVPMEGCLELLQLVRSRGLPVGVVTNSPRPAAEAALKAAGLWSLLDATACAGDTPRPKPFPDLVVLGAQRLGVPASSCWMVGDSPLDVAAARAAGAWAVGIGVDGDHRVNGLAGLHVLLPTG